MRDEPFTHVVNAENSLFSALHHLEQASFASEEAERDRAWRQLRRCIQDAIVSVMNAKELLKGGS